LTPANRTRLDSLVNAFLLSSPLPIKVPSHGCRLLREGGNHSIFVRPAGRASNAPRHVEINDDLAKKICKDLGIPPP
jgi:mRNA interferase HicA